jgi:hypothetical protein
MTENKLVYREFKIIIVIVIYFWRRIYTTIIIIFLIKYVTQVCIYKIQEHVIVHMRRQK